MKTDNENIKTIAHGDICPHCGQSHNFTDPDFEQAADNFTDLFFDEVWREGKQEIKEMSKKEIAEQMYYLGVLHSLQSMDEVMKFIENDEEKKYTNKNRKS